MSTFWTVAGMVAWGLATLLAGLATIPVTLDIDGLFRKVVVGLAGAVVFALSTAGIVVTIIANGWFEDPLPPDGCYRLERETHLQVRPSGKTTTVVPVEEPVFTPIPCPAVAR